MNIRKMLLSLVALGVMGAGAFYATGAFFSDSETSTGNTFEAGKIDLKVDHTYASYNGRECEQQCVEKENLVSNISFEDPEVTAAQKWDIYDSPVGGWNVEWYGGASSYGGQTRPEPAHLEYHRGVLGTAYEGQQYVELDSDWQGPTGSLNGEPATVTIYQNIPTVAGGKYKLRFAFAPRPNTTSDTNRLEVKWGGNLVWDSGNQGDANNGIEWQYKEFEVTATSDTTELRFTDLGKADSLGSFIDNITVNEIVCEGVKTDPLCNTWDLKDLEPGDIFWKFDDVKPGDWGRNVISLHVYDNDAWACMDMIGTDNENSINEPEAEVDKTPDAGELSSRLRAFIWFDTDADGQYDPPSEAGVHNGPMGTNISIPIAQYPGVPLAASHTVYIGIAWCFGEQTVNTETGLISCDGSAETNVTQTDIYNAVLSFYAEQARNNPSFVCANKQVTPTPIIYGD